MPSTYNGIGTHYYGKKNLQTRPGVCEFCGRSSVLSSYDTRLWFVFIFIPVIPLGRKRILNYCPNCTRHRALALAEWEKIKGGNISELMAEMKAKPNDPEAARKLHSALVAFGQMAEADKLAALMQERFAGDAATHAHLGGTLQYLGKHQEALPHFIQALKLNPELPEAKVAVALDLIQKGQLEQAHLLLRFLEAPGVKENGGALYALANGYQRAGRHKEAMGLYELLMERFQKLAQDKEFRKAVKRSETAGGAGSFSLPKREVNRRPWMVLGGAAVVVLAIALVSNIYISKHRTLHVVNGLPGQVTVEVDGMKTDVRPKGLRTLALAEGPHHAVITGAKQGGLDFEVNSSFWSRWFDKPAFILNVDGAALLMVENITYSSDPGAGGGGFRFQFGKPFVAVPDADYIFEAPPRSIRVEKRSGSVRKTHVDYSDDSPQTAFVSLALQSRFNEAFDLAEWHLEANPTDSQTLSIYAHFCEAAGQEARGRAFLAAGAKRRPIIIAWHRAYQDTRIRGKEAPGLVAEYESLLKAEPDNSALLYLRGRLCSSQRESMLLYERAIALDPSNAFAHYALGGIQLSAPDWPSAHAHLTEAVRLRPAVFEFQLSLFQARLALRKYDEVGSGLPNDLAGGVGDFQRVECVGLALTAQAKTNEVEALVSAYQEHLRRIKDTDAEGSVIPLRASMLYAAGRFEELEKLSYLKRRPQRPPGRFSALVELGRLAEASASLTNQAGGRAEAFDLLALSAAWKQAGDDTQAASTLNQAAELLAGERIDLAVMGEILKRGRPVPLEELMDLSVTPEQKALLLVVQAQRFPQGRTEMLAAARRLNFLALFPYHLINRLTAPAGGAP